MKTFEIELEETLHYSRVIEVKTEDIITESDIENVLKEFEMGYFKDIDSLIGKLSEMQGAKSIDFDKRLDSPTFEDIEIDGLYLISEE